MEEAYKCNLCGKEFVSRSDLNAHIRSYLEGIRRVYKKIIKCNVYGFELSCRRNSINHTRTHTGERPFKCTVDGCTMTFKVESTLKSHIGSKHRNERPFQCNFPGCFYTTKASWSLLKHKKVHSDDRPFACPQTGCNFRAKHSSSVKRHLASIHNESPAFACSKCDYKSSRRDSLKTHMHCHSARRDFKCSHPQCPESFKSSYQLKNHFSNRHGERNIQCDHPGCGQKFGSARMLYMHKSSVHAQRRHACPDPSCSFSTNAQWKLAENEMIHRVRSEKITCSIEGCECKAKNSQALSSHMIRHQMLLPRPLSGCDRYAAAKECLKDGLKVLSSSTRRFQCPLCSKKFQKQNHLQNHCVAHTNEKPFKCGHCEYATARHSHVKSHICSVHASIQFPFIFHLLDDNECLRCKVILPTAEFAIHCEGHVGRVF